MVVFISSATSDLLILRCSCCDRLRLHHTPLLPMIKRAILNFFPEKILWICWIKEELLYLQIFRWYLIAKGRGPSQQMLTSHMITSVLLKKMRSNHLFFSAILVNRFTTWSWRCIRCVWVWGHICRMWKSVSLDWHPARHFLRSTGTEGILLNGRRLYLRWIALM